MSELDNLQKTIQKFSDDRDWTKYHTSENLAKSICIEAAELLEVFQWKVSDDDFRGDKTNYINLTEEIADIFIYILMLCDNFGLDLIKVTNHKISTNEKKYPISKSKGNSKKYNEL